MWAEGYIGAVAKIDIENGQICATGIALDYKCDPSSQVMKIRSVRSESTDFFGKMVTAEIITASTVDGKHATAITVYGEDFPRPGSERLGHTLRPADLIGDSTNIEFPINFKWDRRPDGTFRDGDFYCLSEKYFSP